MAHNERKSDTPLRQRSDVYVIKTRLGGLKKCVMPINRCLSYIKQITHFMAYRLLLFMTKKETANASEGRIESTGQSEQGKVKGCVEPLQ
jgi:hypothetical protein